jgi:hypothetical protein
MLESGLTYGLFYLGVLGNAKLKGLDRLARILDYVWGRKVP